MGWQWSSRECGISGTDFGALMLAGCLLCILAAALTSCASAATIQAGTDVQAAIERSSIGDTIIVGPGQYKPFEVNRAINVQGSGWPVVQSLVQKPGITISAKGAMVSGFKIKGVPKDTTSKFDYYMQNPAQAALRLDLPNAGVLVERDDVIIKDVLVFGSQVGLFAEGLVNISILNVTFDRCGTGGQLLNCRGGIVKDTKALGCDKSGIYVEQSSGIQLDNNSIIDTNNSGIMLKRATACSVQNNTASGNKEGIALWDSSLIDVRGNRVSRSYYGLLLSGSDNNTVQDNVAEENSRNEIISGFGVGISLQDNSSHNIVARNSASKSLIGIEMTQGCKYNVAYSNNATYNTHGIRMDKNYNNLIYHNNFIGNTISAYDNSSHTIWNASIGNYYSDYRGKDQDGDGIGDQPYAIPKGNTKAKDARPLMSPFSSALLNIDALKEALRMYAKYDPAQDESIRRVGGVMVIESKKPSSPPEWPASKPLLD